MEYRRRLDSGLVTRAGRIPATPSFMTDGRLANAPIALCEVQGYVYLARTLAARMAEARWRRRSWPRASRNRQGCCANGSRCVLGRWLGMYVLALDGDKKPCRVRTSNAGQLLFTGIVAADRAAIMANTLASADFLTGWGIRTVGAGERRFNPGVVSQRLDLAT